MIIQFILRKGLRLRSKIRIIFIYRKLIRASIKTFRPVLKITNKRIMKYVSMVTIFTMVFGLVFWSTDFNPASADATTIFSEDFDQSGSGLSTNLWAIPENASTGTRDDSDDGFMVGLSGTKGMLLGGDDNSGSDEHLEDPDDGSQRDIATMGYATITVQYSRAFSGFESDDSLVAEYSLDDGDFEELETVTGLTGAQTHSLSELFSIPNPDRHSKLTLRFLVNGTNVDDKVGIDNVEVTGDDEPFFYDGFEDYDDQEDLEDEGGWQTFETPKIEHGDAGNDKMWTDDNDTEVGHSSSGDHEERGHSALLEGSIGYYDEADEVIQRSIDTTGFQNISLRYARRIDNLESRESFKSYYSIDGGDSWISLETINGLGSTNTDDVDFGSVVFESDVLLGADNNSAFMVRFEINASSEGDDIYIDDVVVWGDEISTPTGSISGSKFNDLNGNGTWDEGELGLANWTITLSNGDETTTNESGYYTFEGLESNEYTVCEVMPENEDEWSQTYPNSDSDNIADAVIYESCDEESNSFGKYGYEVEIDEDQAEEINFGNVQYGSITIVKETNPSGYEDGFTFTLTDHNNQQLSDGQSYTYENLIADNYTVQEVVPDGWALSNVDCVYDEESVGQETENGKVVSLGAGDDVVCTFTNTKLGSITVWKYANPFGGGFDFELEGPTPGETTIFTSEDGGAYVFENLEPGDYSLSEDVPEGWTSDGGSCGEDGDPSSLELSAGGNISCVFNNTEYGSISGRKFEDLNANHEDNEDPRLEWDVNLYQLGEGWSLVTSEETDSETGNYMFSNLLPGTYKVCEVLEEGWTQSYPQSGSDCEGSYGYEIVLSAGQDVLNKDFGNYQNGSIAGYKFEDINGDGEWGEEPVLSGWVVYIDANNNGFLNEGETWTTTDENGYYSFTNLEPGDYVIREVDHDGWVQKLPSDGSGYEVTLTSGEIEDGNNFGNFKKPVISETPIPTPTPSETPTLTPTPTPENNNGSSGGGGAPGGIIIDGPGSNNGGGTVAGASTTPTPTPPSTSSGSLASPTTTPTPDTLGSTTGGGSFSSDSSNGGEPSPTPEVTEESPTPMPNGTPTPSESSLPEESDLFAQFLSSLSGNWWWLLPIFALIVLFFIWLSRRS